MHIEWWWAERYEEVYQSYSEQEEEVKGRNKKKKTDNLFSNQKKNILLLANAPSGKLRHIATYDYQETGNSKSSAEVMAPWQTHKEDAESRLTFCNCGVMWCHTSHHSYRKLWQIWFMCLLPSTVLNVLHFQLLWLPTRHLAMLLYSSRKWPFLFIPFK